MKKMFTLFLATTLTLSFLTACGNEPENDAQAQGAENIGGEAVFVIPADAPTLDPHGSNDSATTNASSQIFETLTVYGDDGLPEPLLAESFEPIDDYTWEFVLREEVSFHDGTEFNAEAVRKSFNRLLDPVFASPRIAIFNMIAEVNVIDDYTVQFVTEFPFSPLPAHLAHNGAAIIAPSAIEEENDGGRTVDENPIGTGPFKLESWQRGSEINFVRNDNYWGNLPPLDSLVFRVASEPSTRIAMLETGEANAVIISPLDPASVAIVEEMDHIEINRIQGTRLNYLGFNMQVEPFNDVRVRQAISMAIDRDGIVDGIMDGQGIAANGPLSPRVFGSTQDLETLDFDVEAARSLLAEAGFPDGFETSLFFAEGDAANASIAELAQANLSEIGITVNIQPIEWGAYLEMTAAGEHEMFILGWTTVTVDADYGLYPIFHSSNLGGPGNRTFLENDRVDELLELGRVTTDQDERLEIYAEISQILVDEAPMVYLFHPDFVTGMNGIEGLHQDVNGTTFFHSVSLVGND